MAEDYLKKDGQKADISRCTRCNICTEACAFLQKYDLDIGCTEQLRELSYHCFLCGKCTAVCPEGIDGRARMLELRRERVQKAKGAVREPGYTGLIEEKADYRYRNYQALTKETKRVFFPGCSLPSYFPTTMKEVSRLLAGKGVPTVYDCCGKPIAELGDMETEKKIIEGINRQLRKAKVGEVIFACPNCYTFLKPALEAKAVTIYEALREYGYCTPLEKIKKDREETVFLPCPDREKRYWLTKIEACAGRRFRPIEEVQCCGLGGCAAAKEPDLSAGFGQMLRDKDYDNFWTYCASCAGKFARGGVKSRYLLSAFLGISEKPDIAHGIENRAKMKAL